MSAAPWLSIAPQKPRGLSTSPLGPATFASGTNVVTERLQETWTHMASTLTVVPTAQPEPVYWRRTRKFEFDSSDSAQVWPQVLEGPPAV